MPPRTRTEPKPTEPDVKPTEPETAPPAEPDVKPTEPETAPPAEPTSCGANLADFNPYYRDILCVLEPGHAGNHSDGEGAHWPNEADPAPSAELCAEHYPQGWPSTEVGSSAGCPHGTWVYEG